MNFKIDTREKFSVITPLNENLSDNFTEELETKAHQILQSSNKNLIISLKNVRIADEKSLLKIAALYEQFYQDDASLVLCEIATDVMLLLKENELDDVLNITPTESEAWDIVQMEEMERELLNDDDNA